MFYEHTEEIIELDKSFEKIENAKKSIDFNLREISKGQPKFISYIRKYITGSSLRINLMLKS